MMDKEEDESTKIVWTWNGIQNGYSLSSTGRDLHHVKREDHNWCEVQPSMMCQSTHVNSAIEFDADHILASFPLQQALVLITLSSGDTRHLPIEVAFPHSIRHLAGEGLFMVTDSERNCVLFFNRSFQVVRRVALPMPADECWNQCAAYHEETRSIFTIHEKTLSEVVAKRDVSVTLEEIPFDVDVGVKRKSMCFGCRIMEIHTVSDVQCAELQRQWECSGALLETAKKLIKDGSGGDMERRNDLVNPR